MAEVKSPDELRQSHRRLRAALPQQTQQLHAEALCQRLLAISALQHANHIAVYIAIRGEISLEPTIKQLEHLGKVLYLPILRGEAMHFAPWQSDGKLQKKGFGLLEPDVCESQWKPAHELDLVLAPLVVFDSQCNRIGQGGGYYDRTFAFRANQSTANPVLIGVAHEQQREPQLPVESWDIPLDAIATNKALYQRTELDEGSK
ncbi:MAG: 5-formyltetrahydrofolate cyclo-ligase [Granulosicoccaceae bacterium]